MAVPRLSYELIGGFNCLPLSYLHLALLEQCEANGFGEHDNSVIITAIDEATPASRIVR
jgi:hypothetical protein